MFHIDISHLYQMAVEKAQELRDEATRLISPEAEDKSKQD
jgi:hypothetical protein